MGLEGQKYGRMNRRMGGQCQNYIPLTLSGDKKNINTLLMLRPIYNVWRMYICVA